MFNKNMILINNLCLGIGYSGTLWIDVKARLGLKTRKALMFQKHILFLGEKLVLQNCPLHE